MPTGTVDTFTGTNGAAWNSTNWTQSFNSGSGSTLQIQSNTGALIMAATAFNRTSAALKAASRSGQEIVFDWIVPVASSMFPQAWVRANSAIDGGSGYYFAFNASDQTVGYSTTTNTYNGIDLVTYTHGFTAGQAVTSRIAVFTVGASTTLKMRTWLTANSEPTSSWQINTTDTHVPGNGIIGVTASSGSSGAKTLTIDNFDAHDTETPSQATLTAAGSIAPSGTLTKVVIKKFAGSTTPSGAAVARRVVVRAFSGAIAPAGALVKAVPKVFAGSVTPGGSLTKVPRKVFSGAIAPTATLLRQARKRFSGSIAPVGVLVQANIGRVFGRPGVIAMQLLQRATVTIRQRRD
jgi:hypothetical protein